MIEADQLELILRNEVDAPIRALEAEVRALRAEVQQLRNPTVPVRGSVLEDGRIHWWGMERESTTDV